MLTQHFALAVSAVVTKLIKKDIWSVFFSQITNMQHLSKGMFDMCLNLSGGVTTLII
jgi:hypothetical protein